MQCVFGGNPGGVCSYDPVLEREINRIHAGGFCVIRGDAVISTLLGSCVAICLRDPRGPIAGMNHYLLPEEDEGSSSLGDAKQSEAVHPGGQGLPRDSQGRAMDCRFGRQAVSAMLENMVRMGAAVDRMEAKIFGGAVMLDEVSDIGERNVRFAEDSLAELGIPIVARDVGGRHHRVIRLFSDTGRVMVSRGDNYRDSANGPHASSPSPSNPPGNRSL